MGIGIPQVIPRRKRLVLQVIDGSLKFDKASRNIYQRHLLQEIRKPGPGVVG